MFDSDLDTSGFSEMTDTGGSEGIDQEVGDGVEFLDVLEQTDTGDMGDAELQDDIRSEISGNLEVEPDSSDNVYHATRMSQEEVDRIDSMWQDRTSESEIEPYHAEPFSASEINDSVEPYQAIRIADTRDISDEIDGHPEYGDFTGVESIEDSFASQVESMSFDDLQLEQSRLDQLSQMDDMDIFAEYDSKHGREVSAEQFHEMIDSIDRASLQQLRDGLVDGNPEIYDQLGLRQDDDTSNGEESMVLSRKR